MLAKLTQHGDLDVARLTRSSHLLVVLPSDKRFSLDDVPWGQLLKKLLARKRLGLESLAKDAIVGNADNGTLVAWTANDAAASTFDRQMRMRKAVQPLLDDGARALAIAVCGSEEERRGAAELALYVVWVNSAAMPSRKRVDKPAGLRTITLFGWQDGDRFGNVAARAEGNILCRRLTMLPSNELTPAVYRRRIAELAAGHGWKHREFDLKTLRKMGAGAFVAVAQGSFEQDAAIVHLSYRGKRPKQTVAMVGKGICFDTGGHNLKPARGMLGMHEDMNGSAVALGIMLAATRMKIPVNMDCWLAIAQNHLSATAYKQNDIVTALNGTTIEITHTDAEGRMVLADTLTLAAREKPAMIIDFATLTGSMVYALGNRYSGIFSNCDELLDRAIAAGKRAGERLSPFPLDEDYEVALKSEVADIKQCVIAGEADHILAARFLGRFVDGLPWLHMDLSGSSCEGGLGATGTQTTGFGVGWGLEFLAQV